MTSGSRTPTLLPLYGQVYQAKNLEMALSTSCTVLLHQAESFPTQSQRRNQTTVPPSPVVTTGTGTSSSTTAVLTSRTSRPDMSSVTVFLTPTSPTRISASQANPPLVPPPVPWVPEALSISSKLSLLLRPRSATPVVLQVQKCRNCISATLHQLTHLLNN